MKQHVLSEVREDYNTTFKRLPSYARAFEDLNPGSRFRVCWTRESEGAFISLTLCTARRFPRPASISQRFEHVYAYLHARGTKYRRGVEVGFSRHHLCVYDFAWVLRLFKRVLSPETRQSMPETRWSIIHHDDESICSGVRRFERDAEKSPVSPDMFLCQKGRLTSSRERGGRSPPLPIAAKLGHKLANHPKTSFHARERDPGDGIDCLDRVCGLG